MEKLEILFGFEQPDFEKNFTNALLNRGYLANITVRHTKMQIREYLLMHPECQVAVLKERDRTMSFTAEDFALLTDENDDINIICILSEEHKGSKYMQTLYASGIVDAIFQDGKRGVKAVSVAELCVKRRSRKEARKYYGIASIDVDIGMLSPEGYLAYYHSLFEEENGESLIIRYLNVSSRLTPAQNEDFLKRLPDNVIDKLREYEEFFVIVDALKQHGIFLKYKRPKHLKIGRSKENPLRLEEIPGEPKREKRSDSLPDPEENLHQSFDFGSEFDAYFTDSEEPKVSDEPQMGEMVRKTEPERKEEKTEGAKGFQIKKNAIYFLAGFLLLLLLGIAVLLIFKHPKEDVISASEKESEMIAPTEPLVIMDPIEEVLSGPIKSQVPVTGERVVFYINSYPEVSFRLIDKGNNKQIVYLNGGANKTDIPADATYLVSEKDGEYIFTKEEEE